MFVYIALLVTASLVISWFYIKIVAKIIDMRFVTKTIVIKEFILEVVKIDEVDKYIKIALIKQDIIVA